jgi:hypothetical protein
MNSFINLSDSELYQRCKTYGLNAKVWLRKFAGLLPEVLKRRLYKRRGYTSIHEFAAKLAGMSEGTVDRILRLAKKLEDKPMLRQQFENGLIGWTKLETVAYVATPSDEKEWAIRVSQLTQSALEIFVKNHRSKSAVDGNSQPETPRERFSFEVSSKTVFKFRKFKQQFEKEKGEMMSFEQVLQELLARVENAEQKSVVVERCLECVKRREVERVEDDEVKRSIPVAVQQLVRTRQGGRCAFPDCGQPLTSFHHTRRFALIKSHDPDFIAGLCTAHERIAHASLIENETQAPNEWSIRSWPHENTVAFQIDQKVASFRREPIVMVGG